ncbi:unnamed protein product [Lampetra planeri]
MHAASRSPCSTGECSRAPFHRARNGVRRRPAATTTATTTAVTTAVTALAHRGPGRARWRGRRGHHRSRRSHATFHVDGDGSGSPRGLFSCFGDIVIVMLRKFSLSLGTPFEGGSCQVAWK